MYWSKRAPFFFEDFGSGTSTFGRELQGGKTNYTFTSDVLPDDDYYTILNEVGDYGIGQWATPLDWEMGMKNHTPLTDGGIDPNGYMYLVNAGTKTAGIFYEQEVEACENMPLQFSIWLRNGCTGVRSESGDGPYWGEYREYRIKPNVNIQIVLTDEDGNETILDQIWTGGLEINQREWQPYYFNFLPQGNANIKVRFANVALGGKGNDFAIDDIEIRREGGLIEIFEIEEEGFVTDKLEVKYNHEKVRDLYYHSSGKTSDNKIYFYYMLVAPDGQRYISGEYKCYDFDAKDPDSNNFELSGWDLNGNPTKLYLLDGQYQIYLLPVTEVGDQRPTAADFGSLCYPQFALNYEALYRIIPADEEDPATQYSFCATDLDDDLLNLTLAVPNGDDGLPVVDIKAINFKWGYMDADGNQVLFDDSENEETYAVPMKDGNEYIVNRTFFVVIYGAQGGEYYSYIRVTRKHGATVILGSEGYEHPGDVNDPDYLYTIRMSYEENFTTVAIPVQHSYGVEAADELTIHVSDTNGAVGSDAVMRISDDYKYLILDFGSDSPITRADFENGKNTLVFKIDYELCEFHGTINFKVIFISEQAVWSPENGSTNWNDDRNWKVAEFDDKGNFIQIKPNGIAGVPMADTEVVLPGNCSSYPSLTEEASTVTDDGFLPNTCAAITFEMGAEIGRQDLLNYYKAYVEIDFGSNNAQGKATSAYRIGRGRIYLLSAPLKEMYIGDLFFGGWPKTFVFYGETQVDNGWKTENTPEELEGTQISLTKSISTYNIPLTTGFGFAYVLNSSESYNLVKNDDVVRYPRFENEKFGPYGSLEGAVAEGEDYGYNHWESYATLGEGLGGTTTYRYFVTGKPTQVGKTIEKVNRTSTEVTINNRKRHVLQGNRFITDGADAVQIKKGSGSTTLVGNPFMGHLDFFRLYQENTIQPYYYLYDGTNVVANQLNTNTGEVTSTATTGNWDNALIAPMQSFFVSFDTPTINLTPDMVRVEAV